MLVELRGTVVYKVLQHEVVIYVIFIIMSRGHEVLKGNKVLWLIFKCRLRRLFEAVDNIELAYLIRLDAGWSTGRLGRLDQLAHSGFLFDRI